MTAGKLQRSAHAEVKAKPERFEDWVDAERFSQLDFCLLFKNINMQPTDVGVQVMEAFKDPLRSFANTPSVPRLLGCAQGSALLQPLVF